MSSEIVRHGLTENVLDVQLFAQLSLTGIAALRKHKITGEGVKIAVLDIPGQFEGSAAYPTFLPYKAKHVTGFFRLGIKNFPAVYNFYRNDFHGAGLAGLISYLLPEAEVRLYENDYSNLRYVLNQIRADRPDIVNISGGVPDTLPKTVNSLTDSGITVVSAANYLDHKRNNLHLFCPQVISAGYLYWDRYGELHPYAKPSYERVDVYVPSWNLPVPSGGNTYTAMSGTSIAAPIVAVAGATARNLGSRSPEANRQLIIDTAIPFRGVKIPHFGQLIQALS